MGAPPHIHSPEEAGVEMLMLRSGKEAPAHIPRGASRLAGSHGTRKVGHGDHGVLTLENRISIGGRGGGIMPKIVRASDQDVVGQFLMHGAMAAEIYRTPALRLLLDCCQESLFELCQGGFQQFREMQTHHAGRRRRLVPIQPEFRQSVFQAVAELSLEFLQQPVRNGATIPIVKSKTEMRLVPINFIGIQIQARGDECRHPLQNRRMR